MQSQENVFWMRLKDLRKDERFKLMQNIIKSINAYT